MSAASGQTPGPTVFTVGHSNHAFERFVDLLRGAGVTAVADVRSVPHSRRVPHFDRSALAAGLREADIAYVFLGRELGARPDDPALVVGGVASWSRMAAAAGFQSGLDRVLEGARRHRVALLCAEKEPLDCHRTLLVGRALLGRGAALAHILADGTVEPHAVTERRLLAAAGDAQLGLFDAAAALDPLEEAYARLERRVAWRVAPAPRADEEAGR
jgi:uncharacterized protein (DUF488 family)